ncbi:MAG: hypothetical protein IJP45_09195 [Paludibacteraceae bacterium]|nr:hypothetical protein [Paludibacteraceae bacterium]
MAQVTLWGATYNDVPAVELPSGNGVVVFYEGVDGNNLEYGLTDGTLPLAGVGKVGSMVL